MATMKDIITSPLLLAMVIIGLLYIVGFSLVYLKKAYTHCLELGISKEDFSADCNSCGGTCIYALYRIYIKFPDENALNKNILGTVL